MLLFISVDDQIWEGEDISEGIGWMKLRYVRYINDLGIFYWFWGWNFGYSIIRLSLLIIPFVLKQIIKNRLDFDLQL